MIKIELRQPLTSPLMIIAMMTILFVQASLANGLLASLTATSQNNYQQHHQAHGHDLTYSHSDHLSYENLQLLHEGTFSTLSQLFLNPVRICCPETDQYVPAEHVQSRYLTPALTSDDPPPRYKSMNT